MFAYLFHIEQKSLEKLSRTLHRKAYFQGWVFVLGILARFQTLQDKPRQYDMMNTTIWMFVTFESSSLQHNATTYSKNDLMIMDQRKK